MTRPTTSVGTETQTHPSEVPQPEAQPDPFPYVVGENGEPFHPLRGWEHLRDLMQLLSTSDRLYFVIVERTDGGDRWAQAIGESSRLLVELGGRPEGPQRVGRAGGDETPDDLHTVVGTRVSARRSDYWDADSATQIVRDWVASATLTPSPGLTLRSPDDWS